MRFLVSLILLLSVFVVGYSYQVAATANNRCIVVWKDYTLVHFPYYGVVEDYLNSIKITHYVVVEDKNEYCTVMVGNDIYKFSEYQKFIVFIKKNDKFVTEIDLWMYNNFQPSK
jgi:hypothetical protein